MNRAPAAGRARTRPLRAARLLLEVTRPRILVLVVATSLPILAASEGGLAPWRVAGTLLALALTGAGCSAVNAWLERDTDRLMTRTASRPLSTGELRPGTVLAFGLVTTAGALGLFHLLGGLLASGLAAAVFVVYLLVYTAWLKPRSPLNTVIGGTAGAAAPLLADASLNGELSPFAWLLFAVVFLWTPPHTWAIAIFRRDEYEAAGIVMLPSVAGNRRARRNGLLYFAAMVPATCAPAALPGIGWAIVPIALALDAWLLVAYLRAVAADDPAVDRRAFLVSVRMMGLLVLSYAAAAASPFPVF